MAIRFPIGPGWGAGWQADSTGISALAWPFVITGLVYLGFLALSGEWRTLVFRPRDIGPALQMQLYYLRLRKEHPPQGKHNALQKAAYTFIVVLGRHRGPQRVRHLQAGTAGVADDAVRRLRAGPLLALRGGLALRRIHPASRRPGAAGGSRLAPGDDHRMVSGKVSQP